MPANDEERQEILGDLRAEVSMPDDVSVAEASADAFDAIVCLLAAKDFLDGGAIPPTDLTIAEKEGWIWVAPRKE